MKFHSIKIKKNVIIILIIMFLIILTKTVYGETTVPPDDIQTLSNSPELREVNRFINIVIMMIRLVVVAICGLIAANAGAKVAAEEDTEGPKEAKKAFQKIIWALFLTFAGTAIATLIAKKVLMTLVLS